MSGGSIRAERLTKCYRRDVPVLDDVTFSFEGSGAIGYLGPNGAGKTTSLKLLVGLLRPTAGKALLNGFDPVAERRKALWDVGAVIENPEPYPSETVFDALERVGELRGLDADGVDDEIDRCHDELHLPPLERRCGTLSKGERQRVVLAAARMGDPPVLLLDEPTNGMDPGERIEVRRLLLRLKRDHLILMSSHLITDVAEICDRLIFIDRGRILRQDTVASVASQVESRGLLIEFAGPVEPAALSVLEGLAERTTVLDPRRVRLRFDGTPATRARILEACGRIGTLAGFGPSVPPLEEAYRQIVAAGIPESVETSAKA